MIGQIGQLDRRLRFQICHPSTDAQGSVIQDWRDSATVWAKSETLTVSESVNGNAREAVMNCQFTVRYQRYLASAGPTFRLQFQEENFDIISIVPFPLGRPDRLIITARRRADGAARVFETNYILDGNGGRISDGNGGFLTEGAHVSDGSGGRFRDGEGGFIADN